MPERWPKRHCGLFFYFNFLIYKENIFDLKRAKCEYEVAARMGARCGIEGTWGDGELRHASLPAAKKRPGLAGSVFDSLSGQLKTGPGSMA
ncbi:hypothetical protein [Chromobacterium paludis]|uniref:Uncharacterized protein n=1 Tax=Chromobacterium paludis TaxID=2605945 RepID=A0A5C1DGP5_9NEIS|nr:hypothetical protein [Chromobacterium paludis]QEL55844.1 hypothetical protein FYK34_09840 [Chromobacterium paludis]